jgi:hypothetical protein
MNESERRESHTAPTTRGDRASRHALWVIVLTLPVTIAALAIALGVFGLLLRLLAA